MENRKYPPYMFDVDFGAAAEAPEPRHDVEYVPPRTISLEELAAARAEALADGRAEGIAQSNTGFENQIAETLQAIAQSLTALQETQRRANEDTTRDAVRLALAAAAKLMPHYAKQHGLAEIEEFVAQCLAGLFEGAAVTVRVPEALVAEIGQRIEPIAQQAGFNEGLKLLAGPELGPADCRIDWNDGGAARNAVRLASEIDEMVEKFIEQPPAEDVQAAAEDMQTAAETQSRPAAEPLSTAQTATTEPETVAAEHGPADQPMAEQPMADQAIADQAIAEQAADTPPPDIDQATEDGAPMEVSQAPQKHQAAGPVLPGAVEMELQPT